jgi:hypothetical protein
MSSLSWNTRFHFSISAVFDQSLYERKGHAGECSCAHEELRTTRRQGFFLCNFPESAKAASPRRSDHLVSVRVNRNKLGFDRHPTADGGAQDLPRSPTAGRATGQRGPAFSCGYDGDNTQT